MPTRNTFNYKEIIHHVKIMLLKKPQLCQELSFNIYACLKEHREKKNEVERLLSWVFDITGIWQRQNF